MRAPTRRAGIRFLRLSNEFAPGIKASHFLLHPDCFVDLKYPYKYYLGGFQSLKISEFFRPEKGGTSLSLRLYDSVELDRCRQDSVLECLLRSCGNDHSVRDKEEVNAFEHQGNASGGCRF